MPRLGLKHPSPPHPEDSLSGDSRGLGVILARRPPAPPGAPSKLLSFCSFLDKLFGDKRAGHCQRGLGRGRREQSC